ncbi:hypothetical protein FOB22_006003 [Saccharomyces cerevisiae]|nr:hypothetical protein FOB22_006003 [Saccharomyces cerevisiae]
MDRLAEKQATASMSIVALPSTSRRAIAVTGTESIAAVMRTATRAFMVVLMPVQYYQHSTNATTTASTTSGLVLLPLPASTTSATTTESTTPALMLLPLQHQRQLVLLPLKVPTPALMLLPLQYQLRTSATTTASINVRTSATTTESTDQHYATTTASINVRTSATTTASINVRTSATTTESTNSNTSATTTASTNVRTSATTTAAASTTNATTTASTNSSTNATTTGSTNASAKEDANKDGNAEDNRFHPVTDINKESYKRKGSQMVLLERKKLKLKAQFPNTSENMNVLQFLGFRSDEIKHLFLYGIDIYFCPEGVFTQYGLCKGCQKMFELCLWAGQKVSYRRMAWEALAVERMLRNDEEYKELEDIEPYHGDPVGYLKFFSVKRREIYSQIQRNYAWYLAITRRRETISVLDSTRGKQGSQVFRMSGRQIKELY